MLVRIRLPRGLVVNAGTSTGRVITDQCIAVDAPVGQSGTLSATSRQYCHVEPPFRVTN